MLLCDIGNTSFHFYDEENGRDYREPAATFDPAEVTVPVYYINVNAALQPRLDGLENWTDLRTSIAWEDYYATMGIDRVAACEAVEEGVIVDTGSAITVDVVRGGRFEGGFIYPGVSALSETYRRISPRLDSSFNFDMQLDKMPKNTKDAISYGALGLLAREVRTYGLPVYLTGGDALKLMPLFGAPNHEPLLLFSGMKKIIQKAGLC
ncbi:type III pantothenate kinase [Sulfurimonas sp. HSL-1656]|uniref:type III pantothenate kinase n=1 Tax=Thiomicrolovo subterrani TaxID=3131934 RepID=UPI0031FA38D1